MPKVINFDPNQQPSLQFARDTDLTVNVSGVFRGDDGNTYGRSGKLTDIATYIALSAAQKQAFRDTLVGIFQDLRNLEFPP